MFPKLAGVVRLQAPHETEGNLAEGLGLGFIPSRHLFNLTNMHMHNKYENRIPDEIKLGPPKMWC